jgi:hypothetical protein
MKITQNKTLSKQSTLCALFALVFLFSTFSVSYSQQVSNEVPPLRERMFFGGNFWLSFGTITDIQIAPVIGLWVLPRVAVAVGPNFRYYKDQYDETNIYGIKGYLQYVLLKDLNNLVPLGVHTGIFFHLEDEVLNLESSFWQYDPVATDRFTINTLLIGGGISQQLGRRSAMNFMVLWALNDSGYGVYSNPEIRISFNF